MVNDISIILCADKDQEDIEYLKLNASGIHIAQYLTQLQLHQLLEKNFEERLKLPEKNMIDHSY